MSKRVFRELTTPFLRDKLLDLKLRFGEESGQFQALSRQYARTAQEDVGTSEANLRHYETPDQFRRHAADDPPGQADRRLGRSG